MRGPGRPQSVLAAAVLLLLAGCQPTGAQSNATLVVEGSGSNTAAEFVRSILKNASTVCPPGGAPRRQSRDLRDPRRLE